MAVTALRPRETIPRAALIGAALMIALAIAAAVAGRATGIGRVALQPGQAAETRELFFDDAADGAVLVRSAATGAVVDRIPPQTGHFVRGTIRGLVRDRRREGIGAQQPFRLSRLTDGRLVLDDATTRRRIDLDAFGRTNAGAFAALLNAATTATRGAP